MNVITTGFYRQEYILYVVISMYVRKPITAAAMF